MSSSVQLLDHLSGTPLALTEEVPAQIQRMRHSGIQQLHYSHRRIKHLRGPCMLELTNTSKTIITVHMIVGQTSWVAQTAVCPVCCHSQIIIISTSAVKTGSANYLISHWNNIWIYYIFVAIIVVSTNIAISRDLGTSEWLVSTINQSNLAINWLQCISNWGICSMSVTNSAFC